MNARTLAKQTHGWKFVGTVFDARAKCHSSIVNQPELRVHELLRGRLLGLNGENRDMRIAGRTKH